MEEKRILIFSAGAHIHETYSITAENFKPTDIIVLVEEDIFQENAEDSNFLKEEKPKIRLSIDELKHIVNTEGRRTFSVEKISTLELDEIRDKILMIRKKYPDAKYFFNITAGTATFSASLFLLAVWLGGQVCITRTKNSFTELKIPKMDIKDLNSSMKEIISILGTAVKNKNLGENEGWLSNKKLLKERGLIENIQDRGNNKDRTAQSREMGKLNSWDLIEENREGRITNYRLTSDGIFVYKIISEQ